MKQFFLILVMFLPMTVSAKSKIDFHSMIVENNKTQESLHNKINDQTKTYKVQVRRGSPEVLKDTYRGNSYNVPTDKNALSFEKEKLARQPVQDRQVERLALEIEENSF